MKKLLIVFMIFCSVLKAQENMNVLSYYASDNSLDGQPRIDMNNVLRFFPVYAILENINEVYVIVYYGSKIYESNADKMSGGDYWQTLLPNFKLGDAIQRIEVEVSFSLSNLKSEKIYEFEKTTSQIDKDKSELEKNKNRTRDLLGSIHKRINKVVPDLNKFLVEKIVKELMPSYPSLDSTDSNGITNAGIKVMSILNSTGSTMSSSHEEKEKIRNQIITLMLNDSEWQILTTQLKLHANYISQFEKIKTELEKDIEQLEKNEAIISDELFNEIVGEFADSSYSGPAIRKSDLVITDNFKSARLLYRYYKNNLRYRKALDPAENLGIFRARYVPFPVVGTPHDNKVQLLRPMEANVPVVFEIGLSFGDDVVSGDNTFNPTFSLSRLGVAIVITEKLFKADAEILGLALTYDFNSYASIGFGRNLAQGQSYPYLSFGINKKAFEQLLAGLAGLFQ